MWWTEDGIIAHIHIYWLTNIKVVMFFDVKYTVCSVLRRTRTFLMLLLFFFFKLLLWYIVNSTQLIFTISQFCANEKRVGIHFVMNTICKQRQRWILYTFLQENWTRLPVFPFKQLVSLFVFLIFAKRVIIVNILITYHLFYLSIIHTCDVWMSLQAPI